MLQKNISGDAPKISKTAYISESAVIIGNGCNIQDNVIVHALTNTKVVICDYISLSHGCIVHGPIEVGKNCFIGFSAVVFDCSIGDGCFVSHRGLVRGVKIKK